MCLFICTKQMKGVKILRITHQKINAMEEVEIPTIQRILLSDPWYEKDVWCRYEQEKLSLNMMKVELVEEAVENGNYPFTSKELYLHLYQKNFDEDAVSSHEEYKLGVDTAKYKFEVNDDNVMIYTGGDGYWGDVIKREDSNQNVCIDIILIVPDEYYSLEVFMNSMPAHICKNFKEMKLIQDCDVDIALDDQGRMMEQC